MFDEFRYRWKVRKLQRKQAHALMEVATRLKKYSDGNKDQLSYLAEGMKIEQAYTFEIDRLTTEYLTNKAELYMIPVPDLGTRWKGLTETPAYAHLTREGMNELRAAIREHEKHERERIGFWITAIVGVLGAAIGVIGVLIAYAALK